MLRVNNVSHILYPVNDVARSVEFLSKTLGLYVQERGSTTYLGCGDTLLEVVQAPAEREPTTLYAVGLAVESLDEALRELQSQGVEIVREPWNARTFWGRQAVIRDPGGANIALREWRAPDGPHFTGWRPE
jgi:predicted enzyme related to lactoylglutathione lyase